MAAFAPIAIVGASCRLPGSADPAALFRHLMADASLLGPAPVDVLWEAEKAGWRAFVMGHGGSGYRRGSARDQAWQRGFDAAAASRDPALGK